MGCWMIKPTGSKTSRAITQEQYTKLIDHTIRSGNLKYGCMLLFMGSRGLRISDVTRLKISDVFFASDKGKIKPSMRVLIKKQKKKLTIQLVTKSSKYFVTQLESYYHLISDRDPSELLFQGSFKNEVPHSAIKTYLNEYKALNNIEQLSPHSLRKTFGRSLWDNGVKPEIIQKLFGHQNLNTTMIYLDLQSQDILSAYDLVNF